MSVCAETVPPGWESTRTDVSNTRKALNAIRVIILCVPAPGSPDYKPDDPEYKALRDQASRTLEAFSQFLSTSSAIELVSEVDDVFWVLRKHGEKAGLLSPLLIRAMSDYLDEYEKAHGELPWYFRGEEWIETLYSNLKPEDSGQVCLLPFSSYESALTSNSTLIQNPHAAVVASASTNVDDSGNPQVHSASVAADTATHRASATITSVETTDSARPEVSRPEASPLTSFPALSTNLIQETSSVERSQGVPRAENTPAPQEDSGYARADPDEVSATPAPVGLAGTSPTNPQETESPSGSFLDASQLTSSPAPSTARAKESASAEPTLSAPMSEDAPAPQEDAGPARADPDEVSEALARPNQDGVSATPALVGSGGPSNANPQETESSSTKIPSIPQPAVEISGHADPSE